MEFSFNPYLAFGWSVFGGFLMSMGAGGGGILAGVGHISILGIADANMIKVVNQILEFVSRIFSVSIYHRQKRLVWPLAISFGVGAPIGAVVGAWVSKHYLADMSVYRPVFGALVMIVAARVLYEGWAKSALRNLRLKAARDSSDRLLQQHRERQAGRADAPHPGQRSRHGIISLRWNHVKLEIAGETIEFNPLTAAGGGFVISFVGSTMGVGGGFLVAPFMASMLLIPMFLVVGTGLVALMVPLAVSVFTYILLDVNVDPLLLAVEIPGIIVGSFIGPMLNDRMNEKAMRTFVAAVLLGIGIYYLW